MTTNIEWVRNPDGTKGETWNPITGCSHAGGPGCDMCYARRMARRLAGRYGYPEAPYHFDVTLRPKRLEQPLRWKKPRMIFVCSMSDLFHEDVPFEFVLSIWRTMWQARQHSFQILTKRPDRMSNFLEHLARDTRDGKPQLFRTVKVTGSLRSILPNVYLGTSIENQAAADVRIPLLLRCPAAVRFVSCEPLLEAVDLSPQHVDDTVFAPLGEERFIDCGGCVGTPGSGARTGGLQPTCPGHEAGGIDWVIVGGESGPGARPMHPEWARSLRDQCQAAGIPFFFKSWGAWWPVNHDLTTGNAIGMNTKSCWLDVHGQPNHTYSAMMHDPSKLYRIGKRAAGRLLDGQTWNEFPGEKADAT